jgi:hypothetical protein
MASGTLKEGFAVPLAGLSARATNYSAQIFTPFNYPLKGVGYVTRDRKIPLFLWNGLNTPITLSAIDGNDDAEGISWDATPPDTIAALSSQQVTVTVGVEGPLEYEALLTFLSACAFDPFLQIIGTRAPVLSGDVGYLFFPHNWEGGLDERLAWKTDVMIAHDSTEQRVSLRTMPRRSWDLRLLVSGAARRKLETWLGMRRARYMFVPIWRDAVRLAAPISAGESTIPIESGSDNYVAGTPVAVWSDWEFQEIRTIDGVGSGFLSMDSPFLADWPAGTMIAPCRYCLSLEQRQVSRFTEDVGSYRLTLLATGDKWAPFGAAPAEYRTLPVCPFVPNWEEVGDGYDSKWLRLDNDTGVIEFDVQSLEPVMTREARFLLIGRDDINTFLAFLSTRAGRLSPFWLAAHDRAFELAAPAAVDDSVIVIESIDYEYSLQGSAARSHIEMITTDGTVIRRMIMAVETLPSGEEKLILDAPLGVAVSAATLNRCAWLELVRLDSDEVNLHWVTSDCLQVNVPIMVLP